MINIYIAENIPSLNKGEMTIFEGMLKTFEPIGKVNLSMPSVRPYVDSLRYGSKIRIVDINNSWLLSGGFEKSLLVNILISIIVAIQHIFFVILYKINGSNVLRIFKGEIWKEYINCDLVIVGHDGSFGPKGGDGIPLLYLLYLPFIIKSLRKPVVLYGGSVSKRRSFSYIFDTITKYALNSMDLVTFRDEISLEYARAIGVKSNNLFIVGDPAYLLSPASDNRIEEIIQSEKIDLNKRPIIGFTVTRRIACLGNNKYGGLINNYEKHTRILAEVIDKLVENIGATIIFFPHCIGYSKELDDRIVAAGIKKWVVNKDRVVIITNEYNAGELKGLIGLCDIFIGERIHSVINALSMCVPSIAISNSNDQRLNILALMGQSNSICHTESLNADILFTKVFNVWLRKDEIRQNLEIGSKEIREKSMLNGKLLNELIKKYHSKNNK